jgi:hypothetical protein
LPSARDGVGGQAISAKSGGLPAGGGVGAGVGMAGGGVPIGVGVGGAGDVVEHLHARREDAQVANEVLGLEVRVARDEDGGAGRDQGKARRHHSALSPSAGKKGIPGTSTCALQSKFWKLNSGLSRFVTFWTSR